jgi:hypothetical protein
VFRRRISGAADVSHQPDVDAAAQVALDASASADRASRAITAAKGRPTPKRSEAERQRRQPYTAPSDRKEASRLNRERDRAERLRRSQAMQRGEDWAFPARDRGPVKALARDYIDSRRRFSEFYMYGLVVVMVMAFVRTSTTVFLVPLLVLVAVLAMLVEGIFIGYRIRRLVEQRLPGESTRGVRLYAAMRALQIRQLRFPKPRIKPGQSY